MQIWNAHLKDIVQFLDEYQGEKFHALLSDPPYNLDTIKKRFGKDDAAPAKYGKDGVFQRSSKGFMGKSWDTDIAFSPALWEKVSEFLYPGAFGMCFISTRTYHKLASALEDAGFIIHPMIAWIQSQGFPKATRIDRQIPESEKASEWSGYRYGLQALKPCFEPVVVFQKPYQGSPVQNILETGAGALNIAETKFSANRSFKVNRFTDGAKPFGHGAGHPFSSSDETQLYPTNVIIGEDFDEPFINFFYQAKVSPKERDAGLDTRNPHPTLKPIELTKYLATLLLPPESYAPRSIFIPFAGTGSEAIGAAIAGWDLVTTVELEEDSFNVSRQRFDYYRKMGHNWVI